ncbi:MAG TPA: TetR/AcrR family transcriptional regulator [Candidatus Baltobacteraceae bacterium]|nr:TetR/AcrR family transcriptional regulator [Candidatus Baltobacteraceae bacterium]
MPYEVVKHVGKRAYRYEVSSYRDPQTGKSKGRWRYLGRCDEAAPAQRGGRADSTAGRLLDAFARLIAAQSYASTTVETIAARAGVTPATLYRHFKDKRSLLFALLQRTRGELDFPAVFKAGGDPQVERARVKGFIRRVVTHPTIRSGLARAMQEMQSRDRAIAAHWQAFARERQVLWRNYIAELNANGVGYGDDPAKLAALMTSVAEGLQRRVAFDGASVSDEEIDLWGEVIARILIR